MDFLNDEAVAHIEFQVVDVTNSDSYQTEFQPTLEPAQIETYSDLVESCMMTASRIEYNFFQVLEGDLDAEYAWMLDILNPPLQSKRSRHLTGILIDHSQKQIQPKYIHIEAGISSLFQYREK